MSRITENTIEEFSIELLERLGYHYIYAPDIAPDLPAPGLRQAGGEKPERTSYEEVLLTERLQNAIRRINPKVPADSQEEAFKEIQRINSPELLANNESFHRMLTEGINVSYQKDSACVRRTGRRARRKRRFSLVNRF
ncbi:MAG: type I restriction endonuclease [Bacteroidales bacterium]